MGGDGTVFKGPEFYDEPSIFQEYSQRRKRPGNPNDTIEKPIFWELVGDVKNLRILDLGCGNAEFGRQSLEQGCNRYVGIEGSRKMVEVGRNTLWGTSGEIILTNIEDWSYPSETFDLVVSRLVLHYIEDLESCFKKIHQTLVPGGRFIFSVEHPVLTSCYRSAEMSTRRSDWIVDNYFEVGERVSPWMGGMVIKYHRTIEDYFASLQRTGFTVETLRESRPSKLHLDGEEYERRLRIPLFLFMSARRPLDAARR